MENTARDTGICETLQAIVRHAGKQQPRMIVIEDVHWADPLTLARSAALAAAAQICPTLLILTARTEGDPLNAAWRGKAGGSGLMTMDLGPLRREEAIALAAEFASADDPVAIRCIERSGGNPLFLEQLLRSGNRVGDGVPGSVQSVVLARMDMLAADNRHALQIASILGQRVSAVALRFLIGHSRANWNGLVQDGLLRPDGEDFHFAHALIQEGAYASLPKSRRRNLHRRAADWFAGRDATLHAEHLDRAEDPAAARAYLDAARGQAREYRYEQALHMAERGAELATEPEAFSLHCFVADMLLELGSVDEALAAFEQAREVARENRELCRAWLGRAACLRILDRYSDALEALDRAEAAIGTDRLPEERARICSMRGNLYFPLGRIKDCRNQHQRALEFAKRAASMEAEARAIGGLGDAYYQEGRMLTAFAHFNRCIELSRAHAFSRIEGTNLHVRALTRLYQNDVAGASEDAFAAVDWATKAGDLRARMAAHGAASIVLHDAGEPEEEKQHAGQCLGLAQRLGSPRFEQSARCNQAAALHALGDQAKAEAVLDRAYAICRVSDPGFAGPWILGFLALVTKKPDKRQWALAEGEDLLTNRECVGHNHLQFYRAAMETSLQGAMWREAERYAAALKEYTWSEPLPWSDYFIERARTLAALGRGVRPQALRARLDGLLREGKRADLRIALPALQSAMTVLTSRSHAPPTPQRGG
jgi:tetratricopeptide (TPR) repeat protein